MSTPDREIALGLGENWRQFTLLVVVNGFVGAMVGLERTVLPLLAEAEFGLASSSAALSFIAVFGLVKAGTNFVAGRAGDLYGRRRVLILGWVVAIPVPLMVIWAPTWGWILAANVLLGVNQGLTWSTTVIMKIDLVGPRQRGLAMGLNEFSGYLAVAASALATGYVAEGFGLRPEPFYLGIAIVAVGLALSVLFVRDTIGHAALEARTRPEPGARHAEGLSGREVFAITSWRSPALSSASQAGFFNNLNDGVAWGLFPLLFAASGLDLATIGVLAFVYPATWGLLQLGTGALSDRVGRKPLIALGMGVQALGLGGVALFSTFWPWVASSVVLGLGTAMVYPTLLAVIGDVAEPTWRGSAVGVYRLWRDGGYAAGAVLAGVLTDAFGIEVAIWAVAALTLASGIVVVTRMPETLTAGVEASSQRGPGSLTRPERYHRNS